MLSSTNISIKSLASYCLDYSKLVSGYANLSRSPRIDIGCDLIDIRDIISEVPKNDEEFVFEFELITSSKGNALILNEHESVDEGFLEKRLKRDKAILEALTEINNKVKTQEYTKKVILETGIVEFSSKRVDNGFFGHREISDTPESMKIALLQIPVSIELHPKKDSVLVKVAITDPYVKFAIEPLNAFLKQQYYDEIFELVTSYDANDKNSLPISESSIEDIWSAIKTKLSLMDASNISEFPDFSSCSIKISTKTNYFLAEDLSILSNLDESEMEKTSLGAWSSDDDMNLEYDVFDDGRTEIFFPFQYDKYQLKVLGIIDNKASIVEGPPGTGKSQTIANILCHLAATGKKVLFVSQKDQAVRGVKDKLKSLDIPFLFGYIPDRTSRLYTDDDERDSAVNTLKSIQRSFNKKATGDQKEPLRLINEKEKDYCCGLDGERSLFDFYNQRRALDYVKAYARLGINREWWERYIQIWNQTNILSDSVKKYRTENADFIKKEDAMLKGADIKYAAVDEFLSHVYGEFSDIVPERAGSLKKLFVHNKMNGVLKKYGKTIIQEVYSQVESIVYSEETKTVRLNKLQALRDYFENCISVEKVASLKSELLEMLTGENLSQELADNLRAVIEEKGADDVFADIQEYIDLTEEIDNIEYFSANELNQEIKELQKYYRSNVCNYIRNRILKRIDIVNSQKSTKAILNRIANSLSKSRKAYKTFDKLKNGEDGHDNFRVMTQAIPIWMMNLEDVNRIIPMVANAFDYVILDEGSQCNLA